MTKKPNSENDDIELRPRAWKLFERAVDVVAKSPPQHRTKSKPKRRKSPARKRMKKPGK